MKEKHKSKGTLKVSTKSGVSEISSIKSLHGPVGGLVTTIARFLDRNILYAVIRRSSLAARLRNESRLNIGCGDDLVAGWVNIDFDPAISYGKVTYKEGILVLNFDMHDDLVLDNCIDQIYSSHFIEHITFEDAIIFLKKCYGYLRKGGVIRLSFPDLELWTKKYLQNDKEFLNKYKSIYLSNPNIKTKGEIYMSQVHGYGHRWSYDYESIEHILRIAGFSKISRKNAHESRIQDIDLVEPYRKGRLMESCYIEAIK
jgi:predicted SAM-dependent methyltransferase